MKRIVLYIALAGVVLVLSQFMYVLPLHVLAFFTAAAAIVAADSQAVWWVYKRAIYLPRVRMEILHTVIAAALIVLLTSGVLMAWPMRDYLLFNTAFLIKMCFVLALVINGFFISRHVHVASDRTYGELTLQERRPLFFSGAVSTLGWIGAFVAAQFLGL